MKPHIFLLATLSLVCAAHAQPTSAEEKSVFQMEAIWNKALVDGDVAKLDTLEAKNYIFTDSDGYVHTKADEIAALKAGKVHFDEMSLHEASIKVTGDTAIVTGRLVTVGTEDGAALHEITELTDVLVRNGDSWTGVTSAEVKLADSAKTAVTPLWRDGMGWLGRHDAFVEQAKHEKVDLLFVGDSITDYWRSRGKAQWDKFFGNLNAANIGISGDRTQHVLWRLDNGEVEGLHPKAIVLMISTNNTCFERDAVTPRNTPAEAAEGVKAVVADLRKRMPEAKILLLGVFPRAHLASDPARLQVNEINRIIAGLDDGDHVHYLDIGPKFLTADGTLEAAIMPDFLHPTPGGYEIWGEAIQAEVAKLMVP